MRYAARIMEVFINVCLLLVLQNSKESTRTKLASVVDHHKRRGCSSECADPEKIHTHPWKVIGYSLGGGGGGGAS